LLTLPDTVKAYLKNGQLSAGHGRAIVGSEHPDFLAEMIISKNLSVRQAETLAKERYVKENKEKNYPKVSDPETEVLRQHISNLLNARVDVVEKGLGGKIVIYYKNGLDLDKIMQKFNK